MRIRTMWTIFAIACGILAILGFAFTSWGATGILWWVILWAIACAVFAAIAARTPTSRRFGDQQATLVTMPNNYTAVATVATGDNVERSEIIEIAGVRVRDGKESAKFSQLIKPAEAVPEHILHLTELTENELDQQSDAADALKSFFDFLGPDAIVAPDADEVKSQLIFAAQKNGMKLPQNAAVDVMAIDDQIFTKDSSTDMRRLSKRAGAGDAVAERALPRAEQTFKCFEWLRDYAKHNGVAIRDKNAEVDYENQQEH